MANNGIHLVALRQALAKRDANALLGRIDMARDRNDGHIALEALDAAFEVIARAVNDGDMFAGTQAQHAEVLGVIGGQLKRKRRFGLLCDDLRFQEEAR